jgi:hypothetical protein
MASFLLFLQNNPFCKKQKSQFCEMPHKKKLKLYGGWSASGAPSFLYFSSLRSAFHYFSAIAKEEERFGLMQSMSGEIHTGAISHSWGTLRELNHSRGPIGCSTGTILNGVNEVFQSKE